MLPTRPPPIPATRSSIHSQTVIAQQTLCDAGTAAGAPAPTAATRLLGLLPANQRVDGIWRALAILDHAIRDVPDRERQHDEDEREVLQEPRRPRRVVDLLPRPADVDHQQATHHDGDEVHRDAPLAEV